MSIKELTQEQIETMTLEEKDRWWLENVYKGNMPQLNLRSALTGMLLGGVLSLTNLYIGIKTGWTLGVGISSVILSFAFFKLLSRFNAGREMTILENNAMQSIATSAGYMTSPMMASLPAYMMVTNQVIPAWQTALWIIALSFLGVLFAFPLKKRFINEDQLPFPEGYAAGVVLDNLHSDQGKEGIFKAKLLMAGAALSALIEVLKNEKVLEGVRLKFLALPEFWDDIVYRYITPTIMGTPLKALTIQWDTSIVMLGTGGLMSMQTAMSMLLGGVVNYFICAPLLIKMGIIAEAKYKAITMWSLWFGAAMMTTSSLYAFFGKPDLIVAAFSKLFSKNKVKKTDVLQDIELPMRIFVVGIPVMSLITIYMGHVWFGVEWWLGLIAIPLVFLFTLIAVTATGLTAITPGSALGKLTQITFGALAPGNVTTNLMTAGITSEVSLNASNLLMDIKPAYMLGGKPRHQALGHVIGVIAGAMVAVPAFYQLFHGDISLFTSDTMPLPGAAIWKGVAEVLTKGISTLHPTAQAAALVGAVLGIVLEMVRKKWRRFPISGVGLGLGFVLRFTDTWAMALGSFLFWACEKKCTNQESFGFRAFVDNRETLAAGIIAGGSIIGILLMLAESMVG